MILRTTLLAAALLATTPQDDDHPEHQVRKPLPSPEEIAKLPPDGGPEFNRLVFEQSPYLQQHARNPVDWYPWGEEAFRAAKAQDKPIFLSIGYSTCHWCHVMEHESFEDEDVATLLNETHICIKVDREERPDLDHIYMTVTQTITRGSGGWPMSVWMTAEKKPFLAGTYFPKTGRHGRKGFIDILNDVHEFWTTRKISVAATSEQVLYHLQNSVKGTPGDAPGGAALASAEQMLTARYDPSFGGFGNPPQFNTPKFPVPHNLRFLLRQHARSGKPEVLGMVESTLQAMRAGGMWDHVGHGFHRYSTDRQWLVPHFEKMLYDQALLVMAYLEAYLVTKDEDYARTAREILAYVSRDMTSAEGGFYSAEDADSEGEEGLFYLWTIDQLQEVLGPDDAAIAIDVWNVTQEGNYADEATGQRTGRNILHRRKSLEAHAADREVEPAEFRAKIEDLRARLFEAREPRIHPLKDDKVLTDWNGLMIAAYAQAARVLGDESYALTARRAADHLLTKLRREDGRLYKLTRLGQPAGYGMLEDYAFAAWGLLETFETLQQPSDLAAAKELVDVMLAQFRDEENGGFFLAPEDGEELIVRPKEIYDGAIPSGNSVAAGVLLRLGRLLGEPSYEEHADGVFKAFGGDVAAQPSAYTQLLLAVDFAVGPSREVIVVGTPGAADTRAMLAAVHGTFAPNKVVVFKPSEGADELVGLASYLAAQTALEGAATAYVCENYACQAPTTDPAAVRAVLSGAPQDEQDGEE